MGRRNEAVAGPSRDASRTEFRRAFALALCSKPTGVSDTNGETDTA